MNLDEAYNKWATARDLHDLPWEIDTKVLRLAFEAGWHAHAEAGKQQVMPLDLPSAITPEDIYKAYPRKVGKQAALKAIAKAAKARPIADLLAITQTYAAAVAQWPAADKQFIPHPATWFNQARFDDDQKEWQRGAAALPPQFAKNYR